MTMDQTAYDRLHIAGSVVYPSMELALSQVEYTPDMLIVLYCTTAACQSSYQAYYHMTGLGFSNVVVLDGGLQAWLEVGYAVAGNENTTA